MSLQRFSESLYEFIKKNGGNWSNGAITTEINIDQSHIEFAKTLHNESIDYEIFRNAQSIGYYQLRVNDVVQFQISPPRNQKLFYAENLDDLLKFRSTLIDKPEDFLIQSQDYKSWESNEATPLNITAYIRLCDFLKTLLDLEVLARKVDDELLLFFSDGTLLIRAKTTNAIFNSVCHRNYRRN